MKTNKLFNVEIKEVEDNPRVLRFIGSDETLDRASDVMTLDGWELDNYIKNPVFLFGHDYSQPPIGKAIGVSITEKGLEFDIEFADKETYPFADTIHRLFKGGFMKAVSVGFIPKESHYDPKANKNYITKKELLELSAVSVPANPNAVLTNAFQKGIISQEELDNVSKVFGSAEKIGRTISRKNESALIQAKEAMQAAISSIDTVLSTEEDTEENDEGKAIKNIYDKILDLKGCVGGCSCKEKSHENIVKTVEDLKKILI